MISILVVDEESRYRQRLAEEMSTEGYQVTTAGDTRRAKDLLNSRQWKLVLVNPYIKGNQGFDLLNQCGKDQSDPSVIVIVPQHAPKENWLSKADGFFFESADWEGVKQAVSEIVSGGGI